MENYVIDFATKILNIDSPTGYCKEVIEFVKNEVEQLGSEGKTARAKGNGMECAGNQ